MEQPIQKNIQSFQQQLSLIQLDNGRQAYAKKIVSNYSWWTFEQTDVFHRELTSYHLLTGAQLVPKLLAVDQEHNQFMVEALPTQKPDAGQLIDFANRLITLLSTLQQIPGQALQTCSFSQLRDLYWQKGQAAHVNPWLLEELAALLTKWSQVDPRPLCYVHGDLHFGNLLYDGQTSKLIDFEEAIQSHPLIDATSLSWDIVDCFGEAGYNYFNRVYRDEVGVEVPDLGDWKRFCQLRDWVVSCYLARCCSLEDKQKAIRFLIDVEPQQML